MNSKKMIQKLRTPLFAVAALALMAGPSLAVDLMAVEGTWTPAGGTPITMWGFAADTGSCPVAPVNWNVGPQLTDADLVTGDLIINLRNCLSEGVSIVIPGQPATTCDGAACTPVIVADGQGRDRVRAFTTEAAGNGGTVTYQWTGVKDGTYLYQSGSHPAKQVQMGLYGALTLGIYTGTNEDVDPNEPIKPVPVALLYSEIDPALHRPPAAATPLGYHPRHYLVNGLVNPPALTAGDTNRPTVLRFLNAGLDFHVPALNSGYMELEAEDGNPYPFVKKQYSVNLAAGKTIDALWQPATAGDHVIYDRRGNGMVASLTVETGTPPVNAPPIAVNDGPYGAVVDVALNVGVPGVLGNDTDVDFGDTLTASVVTGPSNGTLTLNANGSFIYTPTAAGPDIFTYQANDGTADSNIATVTLNATVATPNTAPVAVDDDYVVDEDSTLNVTASTVLGNDTDADVGDTLTAVLDDDVNNGTLALNTDGTFTYLPDANFNGSDSFTYHANDGTDNSNIVTVSITVDPVNDAPVAVNDAYTVDSGATLIADASTGPLAVVLANDSDIEGDTLTAVLVPGSGPASEDFVFNPDGSFTYGPADAADRLSDSFSYQACDGDPAVCATATVNITINDIVTNTPPVAVADTANVVRRTRTFINLTGNDTDVDNNIDPDGIVITAAPNQGGSVVVMPNGVEYRAPGGFATNGGAEEDFSYTVRDLDGATSNEGTVTVHVFRRANQLP